MSDTRREADTKLEFGFGFLSVPDESVVSDVSYLFAGSVLKGFSFENYDLGLVSLRAIWVDAEQAFGKGFGTRLSRGRALEIQVLYRDSEVAALPNLESRAAYMAMLAVEGLGHGLSTHRVLAADAFRLMADVTMRLHVELGPALSAYRARCEDKSVQLAYVPNIGKAPAPNQQPKLWFGSTPFRQT